MRQVFTVHRGGIVQLDSISRTLPNSLDTVKYAEDGDTCMLIWAVVVRIGDRTLFL